MKSPSRNRSFFKVISATDPSAPTCALRSLNQQKSLGAWTKQSDISFSESEGFPASRKFPAIFANKNQAKYFNLKRRLTFKSEAMVQEFMILRCFSCTTFQVHQVRIVCIFANSNLLSSISKSKMTN